MGRIARLALGRVRSTAAPTYRSVREFSFSSTASKKVVLAGPEEVVFIDFAAAYTAWLANPHGVTFWEILCLLNRPAN